MNLLTDHWIPVHQQGRFRQISLSDLLCTETNWQISLPRDDMEMAALQLLISLTQVLLIPADKEALKKHIRTPLSQDEYQVAIETRKEWFDLDHPDHPFMQSRGVKAKKLTDMAKLFAGLTGATCSVFVNEPDLATRLCSSCAVIGLYNQANNCPGFGGGFKASMRGSAPITTLVQSRQLRETVWNNVLSLKTIIDLMPWYTTIENDSPNWIETVAADEKVPVHQIGLLRGLFWQPAHIELMNCAELGTCDCCGQTDQPLYDGFNKEKFRYTIVGMWPHPHSPHGWKLSKGEKQDKFASFTTTAPAWALLSQFIIEKQSQKVGHSPATVITQAKQLHRNRPLFMLVGGFRIKQASILDRHHDLFNLALEWQDNEGKIEVIVTTGLAYKTELRKKLFAFYKATGIVLHEAAEKRFYSETEPIVHALLREMNFKESKQAFVHYHDQLSKTTRTIFEQVTQPYQQNPAMIRALTITRRSLEKEMKALREE